MRTVSSLFVLMLLAPILLVLLSCQPRPATPKTEIAKLTQLPELLPRSPLIGTPEEQAYIINTYNSLAEKLQADPYHLDAKLKMAQLFMLEARATGEHGHYYPAALKMTGSVLAQNPPRDEEFQALLLQTSVYLSLHQFERALQSGEKALALNPHNALIYGALVDAHVELGQYAQAVEYADKMVAIRPDLRSYARVSYLREIHGDVPGAIEAMKLAVSAGMPGYEDAAWCRYTLGKLYERYGQHELAGHEFRLCLDERPNYPFALAALADLHQLKGEYQEAEKLLDQACAIIPEVGFYEQKAALYQKMGKDEQTAALSQEILAMLADDEANGHKMDMEYARVYRDLLNDLPKALEHALAEYRSRPDNAEVNELLASIYFKMDELEAAEKHIEKALATESKDPELLCLSGLILIKAGNEAQGRQQLEASMRQNKYQQHAFAAAAQTALKRF